MKATGHAVVMGAIGVTVLGFALATGGVRTATHVHTTAGKVDEAIEAKNVSAAVVAWHAAYGAALQSGRWEPLVEAGDAAMRIAGIATARRGFEMNAREAYLAAHVRARRLESADGAMRVAEAFSRMGDVDTAHRLRRSAERMASAPRP